MLKQTNKITGFTIIELMIAVTIGAILMAIALPAFNTVTKNNCLTTSANNLLVSLQLARSMAIKHRSDVSITANGASNATNKWGSSGWTVTINEDRDGDGTLDTGEDYNGNNALDSAATVRVMDTGSCKTLTIDETSNDTSVLYGSNGRVDGVATFRFCDDRTREIGRQLTMNALGRPTIDTFTCT